jgi:hypothetical protein
MSREATWTIARCISHQAHESTEPCYVSIISAKKPGDRKRKLEIIRL